MHSCGVAGSPRATVSAIRARTRISTSGFAYEAMYVPSSTTVPSGAALDGASRSAT